jgi:glycosyltransferase involved in cell wall biosynthesis
MTTVAIICGLPRSLMNFRGDLLMAMRVAGHTVVAIGPEADAQTLKFLAANGIEYRAVALQRSSISPARDLALLRGLRSTLADITPNCVIAYTIKPVIYGMLAAASLGIKSRYALITGLGFAFTDGNRPNFKRSVVRIAASLLYGASLRAASGVMFQNPDDQALFRNRRIVPHGKRCVVVPGSGVDTSHFRQQPVPDVNRFLMVSRLVGDKGVREFLGAAKAVYRKYPETEFHLVGPLDPHPSAVSQAEIKMAQSQSNLTYHGETDDVRPHLSQCSVFVLPSYREGMPRSVLEAMSVGRAIITTDAPGCRDTVDEGQNGFKVPPRDTSALANAMMRFAVDPSLAQEMGQKSRGMAEAKFSVEVVTAAMLEFCQLSKVSG